MELIKRNVHMNKLKCKSNVQLTLDNDFNVPDVKPDIERIVKEQGDVVIQEVKPMNGKAMVKGSLNFSILYLGSDEERPIHNITGQLPFEEVVNMDEACAEDNVSVKWEMDDLSTGLINSRKISVRAILSFTFTAEDVYDEETAVAATGSDKIHFKNKKLNITQIAMSKKDTHRIKDEVKLPSGKPNLFEILYHEMNLQSVNTRLMENHIELKGDLHLFLLYIGEDEEQRLQYFDTEIPFSGSVDCSGCNEDMVLDMGIHIGSRDIQLKPDEDGEERILDCEIVLELNIKVYEEEELEILSDIYSTAKEVIPAKQEAHYENLILKNNSKARVVDRIRIAPDQEKILQICNATGNVRVDEENNVSGGVEVSGVIEVQILYITENDKKPLGATKGVVPFTQLVEVKDMKETSFYDITPSVEQVNVTVLDGEEVEVKAVVVLDIIAFDKIKESIITDLTVEELDLEKLQEMPGMIGYIVKEGDSLWNIAKRFYTTVDNIKELNEMENEQLKWGDTLLLMKQVDFI